MQTLLMRVRIWLPTTMLLCWFAASMAVSAGAQQSDALSAEQILAKMSLQYRSAQSYSDSGVVTTVYLNDDGQTIMVDHRPFTTSFTRAGQFRFEFEQVFPTPKDAPEKKNPPIHYIVWRQGSEVKRWWDLEHAVTDESSLNLAIAGATGVSDGSAHSVPALLMPSEIGGRRYNDGLEDVTRLSDAKLGEIECFRVKGMFADSPATVWIDAQTFLIRKIERSAQFSTFHTETTMSYNEVAINQPIAEQKLAFAAPGQ